MRGSSDILAAVEAQLAVRRDKHDKKKLIVEQAKLRCAQEIEPFELCIESDDETFLFEYLGVHDDGASKKEEAKKAIPELLENHKEGLSKTDVKKEITASLGVGQKAVQGALNELIKEEVVIEQSGERNKKICFLADYVPKESSLL